MSLLRFVAVERVPVLAVDAVVELVNECSDAARAAAGEDGLPRPTVPALGALGDDPERCRRAADSLHGVFTDERGPVPALNDLLAATGVRPRLGTDGRLVWVAPADADMLLAGAVVSLVAWVDAHGTGRLGVCGADRCVDVFVDGSRAATRRYCSETCLNRSRVARWRSRRSAAGRARGRGAARQ